jgi:hypothetical protein
MSGESRAARIGTATHQLLANPQTLLTGFASADLSEIKELVQASQAGLDAIEQACGVSSGWQREVALPPTEIADAGTADLVHVEKRIVVDYKTGFVRSDATAQLTAYAAGLMYMTRSSEPVRVAAIWARHGEFDLITVTHADVDALQKQLAEQRQDYNPGDHCGLCPRSHECPALDAWVRASSQALTETAPAQLTPEFLATLYPRAQALEKAIENYRTALRSALESGAVLQTGDGRTLQLKSSERRSVKALEAWPVLSEYLSDAEIAGACNVSLTAAKDALAAKLPRGDKGKALARFVGALEEANAIETKTVHSISCTKTMKGKHNE